MEYFKQEKDYTCGCACVRMALSVYEANVPSEEELELKLGTLSNAGTDPKAIEQYFKDLHYEVVTKENSTVEELQQYFKNGYTIMLAISVDVPHFTIYGGHNNNHITFWDPYFGIIFRTIRYFKSPNIKYPLYRWRVVSQEFKKYFPQYNFDDKQSNCYFLAVKKTVLINL